MLLLVTGIFFGWSRIKGRYQRWNAGRQVTRAAELVVQGDYQRAIIYARKALDANPASSEATRTIAEALEGGGAQALAVSWRNRLDSLEPGNQANILAWAADALFAKDFAVAERVLGMLKPESRNDATYHAMAARLAAAKGDSPVAESHWTEAARLRPNEESYQLPLAIIRLKSKDREQRAAAIQMLTEIGSRPARGTEALRALLTDATECEDWKRAGDFADALVAAPGATFPDKLAKLWALRKMNDRESVGYIMELRDSSLSNPKDLYLLLMWMNQHDLALMVSEWSRTLSPDVIGMPPVCVAVADAYARGFEWQRLLDFAEAHPWADWDYLRRAFRARALERLGEVELGAQEWNDGITAARGGGESVDRLERMARLAIGWGWDQRAQEVMWSLAGSPSCPRWMLDLLWEVAIRNANTPQLQKLAGVLAQCDAKSVTLRNNHAFYSLLVRSEDGDPHREAERLLKENPGDASIVVTRCLSLYQQGKTAEALALTGSLPDEELKKPQAALYHAIFLTAAGESAKAAGFLSVAESRKMFPEEKTMLERAGLTATKAAGEQDVLETSKAMRAAKAAGDIETEKAVEAARVARAAKAARESEEAQATKAARAAKAADAAKNNVPAPVLAR